MPRSTLQDFWQLLVRHNTGVTSDIFSWLQTRVISALKLSEEFHTVES